MPNQCKWTHEGPAGEGRTYVRCEVCGARFPCLDDHLATLSGECPGPRDPWPQPPAGGPGTELKAMLAGWPFYMVVLPGCSCNATAAQMDAWGDECGQPERMAWIVARLRAEAQARGIVFVEAAGRLLVRRAIVRARRAAATRAAAVDAAARL